MGSTFSPIDKFSSLKINHLRIVLSTPIIIDITITFMFHRFLILIFVRPQGLGTYVFFLCLEFTHWYAETAEPIIQNVLSFFCY